MDYSDYEHLDLYQQLDFDNHIELSTGDEHPTTILAAYGTLSALSLVEQFVRASINSKSLPVFSHDNNRTHGVSKRRSLADYYPELNRMIGAYDEQYFYSPRVDAFFQACLSLGLVPERFIFGRNPLGQDPVTGHFYLRLYHALIMKIREVCGKSAFRRKLREQERSVRRREAKALMWEHELFRWKSRHLFIPLTLEYKPEFRGQVTPELVQEHLQRLLGNRRSNRLLDGIRHYVWRIEEGDKVGLHVHILIAYAGKSHEDMSISRSLCHYWETVVTEGIGHARSSSMFKHSDRIRVFGACAGQIDAHEQAKRQVLRKTLSYLVKADQFLKRKTNRKFKTFAISQPPEHSGMGRPRNSSRQHAV